MKTTGNENPPVTEEKKRFTQKDIAIEWGVHPRTVTRYIRKYNAQPVDLTGNQPVFSAKTVRSMERKRAREWSSKLATFRRYGKLSRLGKRGAK